MLKSQSFVSNDPGGVIESSCR